MTLTYQPIPETDYDSFAQSAQMAFGDDTEIVLRWLRSIDRPTELRGMYADGRLVTQLELYPFEVQSGQTPLAACGIGAVSTPPHERRRGHVAQILRAACDEIRERGMSITLLGAFKESFYGQYGWAVFGERRYYRGAPQLFAPFKPLAGQFTPAGVEQIDELDAIYRTALRGRFGLVIRSPIWWRRKVLSNDYWPRYHHTFIWRDPTGHGRSYLIYRIVQEGEKQVLRVHEAVALDPQARSQLFVLLANFRDQVDEIQLRAPADAPVNLLFPDSLECHTEPLDMLRIVDVAMLLNAYSYPREATGRLTIAISDNWLPHNNGVFALEVAGGVGQCTRVADTTEAGLRCDIRALVPVISRYVKPRTAAAFGLLEAPDRGALGLAEQFFAGLAPFLSDSF